MGYIDYTNLNQELKDMISQGGGGTPIDPALFVRTVNNRAVDANGNVNTDFRIVDPIRMDENWNSGSYVENVSEFYVEYDKNDYAQYIADNASFDQLSSGMLAVRTTVNTANGYAYQQIDSVKDGVFEAEYCRVGYFNPNDPNDPLNGTWGELVRCNEAHHNAVMSVNGITPNSDGEITIPNASTTESGLVKVDGTTITVTDGVISAVGGGGGGTTTPLSDDYQLADSATAASTKATKDLYDALNTAISDLDNSTQTIETNITNLQGRVNTITPLVTSTSTRLVNHESKIASNTELGHVKIDGSTITINAEGVISANAGGSVTPTVVVDNLESTSSVDALSANQGRELKTQLDAHKAKVATATEIGQVKPDNITTFVNVDGTITAIAAPTTWGSF